MQTLVTLLIAFTVLVLVAAAGLVLKGYSPLEAIANIAQIIEGVAMLVLLLIAADIRESIKARHLDGIRYIKSLIGTDEASEGRNWVHQTLKKESWPLSPEDENKALAICKDFDHVGYLCRKRLIPVNLVVETYNRNIIDMWNRLERFIVQWRQQWHDEDYFWEFEWLARKAEVTKKRFDKKRRDSG